MKQAYTYTFLEMHTVDEPTHTSKGKPLGLGYFLANYYALAWLIMAPVHLLEGSFEID